MAIAGTGETTKDPLAFVISFVLGVIALVAFQHAPVERQLSAYVLVLLAGIVVTALVVPTRLPIATVVTRDQGTVTGKFVLISDATWYLGSDRSSLRAIPAGYIVCAQIVADRRPRRFWAWVFESTEPDRKSAQPEPCREAGMQRARPSAERRHADDREARKTSPPDP